MYVLVVHLQQLPRGKCKTLVPDTYDEVVTVLNAMPHYLGDYTGYVDLQFFLDLSTVPHIDYFSGNKQIERTTTVTLGIYM